jgi:hypothetical protein
MMRGKTFPATAAGAAPQRVPETGAPRSERLQSQQPVTKMLFVSEGLQRLQRRPPVGEQAIQMILVGEINLAGVHHLRACVFRNATSRAAYYAAGAY